MYTYRFEFITSEDHPKRGIIFLISKDRRVTAKAAFGKLNINTERMLRTRFDNWIDGLINKKWYHGWNQSEFQGRYTKCFVFKCKERRSQHRFYGFLCNPKPNNRSYQVCVLVIYARKNEWETDETFLKKIEEIRTTFTVQESVEDYFMEKT